VPRVEIGVLGSLTVHVDGREVGLDRPKERALLAVLAFGGGRPVARDRIIDALWGEQLPGSPDGALRAHIRRVRAVVGRDAINTTTPGYALSSAAVIDVDRFRSDVRSEGDAGARAAAIGRALTLWRGRPYDDLGDWPAIEPERQGLLALYDQARVDWADARLAAGESSTLLALLEELVSEQPLVDRRWELLVLALSRSGRKADALRAFQRARHAMQEAGLEPGRALVEIDRAVAANDAVVARERRSVAALIGSGIADHRAGREHAAREAFAVAEQLARDTGDSAALAEVAVARSGDGVLSGLDPESEVMQLLSDALDGLPNAPTSLRARVLARLAVAGGSNRDPRLVARWADEALATARLFGDVPTLVLALHASVVTSHDPAALDKREATARELLSLTHDDVATRALALSALARVQATRGAIDAADASADEAFALAHDAPADIVLATLWYPLFRATLVGDRGAAASAARAIADVAPRALVDPGAAPSMVNAIDIVLDTLLGGRETGRQLQPYRLDTITWPLANLGHLAHAGTAMQLTRAGQPDAARAVLGSVAPSMLADLDRDMYWPGVVWTASEAVCALGDEERAQALYDGVAPFAGVLLIDPAGVFLGCTDHYLALLAQTEHRDRDARRHLDAAGARYRGVDARWWDERLHDMRAALGALTRRD